MNNKEQKVETSTEAAIVGNTVLPAVRLSMEEILKDAVEKSEKELEEKKKVVQELENKLKERKNGNK